MKVEIEYQDLDALAPEEIVARAKRLFGKTTRVRVSPDSSEPYNLMYFAIQQLVTSDQVTSYIDDGVMYKTNLEKIKNEAREQFENILEHVVSDNEIRLEEE